MLKVFDLGMNNGDDAAYYLGKGFDVIAVEANPVLCATAKRRFGDKITIVNAIVCGKQGQQKFYLNLDNNHWSSIDRIWASRNKSRTEEITVQCLTINDLFAQYGIPHYAKIDIEGADLEVLASLSEAKTIPTYLSIEDCRFGFQYLAMMKEYGYRKFNLSEQSQFSGSSGPFGDDLGGWMTYDKMLDHYVKIVRDHNGRRIAPENNWFDIHCRMS